jgi:hypothetical protein
MANFTLETNRNTAITNIPRLTFQLPQSTSAPVASTLSPIFFCQTGCQLEFAFKNINSATLKNDGRYFTIIPNADSNNYINWNGSGVSGQNMTRFDLKEIKFSAPAKDVVGSITYNKSIQFYFTFVNSTYTNIMIIISIIGQANNVGNALTDGYILLNSLTNQIPLRNDTKTVSNLGNFNLGNLLPTNKSFFSTLLNDNNLQYIFMTRIIDIPEVFLNNLISRVIGSKQSYESMVNKYTQEIPTNPQGTIIFYTENVNPISSEQAYVCNSNCDRVVGNASLLQPTIGSSTTKSVSRSSPSSTTTKSSTISKKIPEQECEEEYVFPGTRTNVKVKSESGTTSVTEDKKELTNEEFVSSTVQGIIIGLLVIFIVGFSYGIFNLLSKVGNVSGMEFFSKKLWGNRENIPWIIITFIGFLAVVICFSISIVGFLEENSEKEKSKRKIKIQWWGLFLIGACVWIPCIIILFLKYKYLRGLGSGTGMGTRMEMGIINRTNNSIDYKEIQKFETLKDKIIKDYSSNPNFLESTTGKSNLLEASKIYNNLPLEQKLILDKNNPQLATLLSPESKIIQSIQSQSRSQSQSPSQSIKSLSESNKKEFNNLILSLNNNPTIVTPKILAGYQGLQTANPDNKNLQNIENKVKVGNILPASFRNLIKKYEK